MSTRTTDLAVIHIGIKQLGLDDESYRAMLRHVAGVASAKDLDATGRRQVIAHLRAAGFKPGRPRPGVRRGTAHDWRAPRIAKIHKLWFLMRDAGVLRDPSEKALQHFCAKLTRTAKLDWADGKGLNAAVEALRAWARREGVAVE